MALEAIKGEFVRAEKQGLGVVNYAWWLKLDDLVTKVMSREPVDMSEPHETRSFFGSFAFVEFDEDGFRAHAKLSSPLERVIRVDYRNKSPRLIAETVIPTANKTLKIVDRFGIDPAGRLETNINPDLANDVLVVGEISPVHVARALSVAALPSAREHAQAKV